MIPSYASLSGRASSILAQQRAEVASGEMFDEMARVALAVVLVGVAVVVLRHLLGLTGKRRGIPDVRRAALMTQAERRVIRYIEQALPHARIHAQVSMGALMQPARGLDRRTATITRNRFSSKRVDFVAEDKETGEVIAIIELDDWSHNRGNDRWRDRMTARAGYRTIRLPGNERHTRQSVRARIERALYPETSTPPTIGQSRRR